MHQYSLCLSDDEIDKYAELFSYLDRNPDALILYIRNRPDVRARLRLGYEMPPHQDEVETVIYQGGACLEEEPEESEGNYVEGAPETGAKERVDGHGKPSNTELHSTAQFKKKVMCVQLVLM